MKRKKAGTRIIAAVLLPMLIILTASCNVISKESLAIAETSEHIESASIAGNTKYIAGKVYTFGKDNAYNFSSDAQAVNSSDTQTYGSFSISGIDLTAEPETNEHIASYSVPEGYISIQYTYSDDLLSASAEEWHLADDNTASIDVFKIGSDIQKGAIVLQKSMDHLNWYNVSVQTNAFENTPVQSDGLYETTDIEMINGCYYRLVVVYKLARKREHLR